MSESNYWMGAAGRRLGRRALLRGSAIGIAGLAGAALIGCGGGDEDPAPSGGGGSTAAPGGGTAAAGNGAPANVTRAAGFDPNGGIGEVPVNTREFVPGGTFRTVAPGTTTRQDPELSPGANDFAWIADRLVIANGWTGELSPDLLESYEVKSQEEVILTLRPGIKTHDMAPTSGRVFNAEDVVWSIHRKAGLLAEGDTGATELKPIRASHFVGLNRAEAVDERTVRLVMDRPNSSIMNAFAHPGAVMYPIEMREIGFVDPLKFVGTGAWIQTEFVEGTRQVFTANPDYYRTWDEGGRPGYEISEKIVIGDRSATLAAFLNGEISGMEVLPHEVPQIQSAAGDTQWLRQLNNNWTYFSTNRALPNLPFFADERVRQALQLSHDYKALGDGYAGESQWVYSGPLPVQFPEALTSEEVRALPGYNPDTKEADIAKALQLLDGAGYPNGAGMNFKLHLPETDGANFETGVRMKDHWSKIFPDLEAELTPFSDSAAFTNLMNTRTFEARIWGNSLSSDAALEARQYYYSDGSRNFEGFSEPWADEAIDAMFAAQSLEERREAIRGFQTRYVEEGPGLTALFVATTVYGYQPTVAGIDLVSGHFASTSSGASHRWLWQTKDA